MQARNYPGGGGYSLQVGAGVVILRLSRTGYSFWTENHFECKFFFKTGSKFENPDGKYPLNYFDRF